MYFAITNSIKKRFVLIFQELIKQHPLFAEKTEIFTKFPEVERPKIAILVRSCSGSSMKLSLDNFAGTRQGFCFLANLKDVPGHSIEWVRDDIRNEDKLSPPGYYIVKMTDDTHFTVDPFYLVKDEPLDVIATFEKAAFVKNVPVNPGSDILFSSEDIDLKRNIDYSIDYTAGKITFLRPILSEETFTIDYQTLGNQTGPFVIDRYEFNNTAIPGAILAFGDRLKKDDEQVVIIEQDKNDVAQIYSGRWNLSLDNVIVAQDPDQQERLTDYIASSLWSIYQDKLTGEGIAIDDFSFSGESEDLEVEIPEEYNFTAGLTFSIIVDWEVEVPLVGVVRKVTPAVGLESLKMTLSDEQQRRLEEKQYDQRMLDSGHQIGIQQIIEPVVTQPSLIGVKTRKYV